ncbi:MAG: hypothetical protein R3F31_19105 [Verrucomicrobiales bacterium]
MLCEETDLVDFLDLGLQPMSGIFPGKDEPDPVSAPLTLRRCSNPKCSNVQLSAAHNLENMAKHYSYYSGISPMMENHLKTIASEIESYNSLNEGDNLLDIGCNDCTLLNQFAERGFNLYGMDPSASKFQHRFSSEIKVHFDFFSKVSLYSWLGKEIKFKSIFIPSLCSMI